MTESEFRVSVREICRRHGATRIVLFGSRARGTNAPGSDFDVAVWGTDATAAIAREADALPTLFSAEVVNMDACGNALLAEEVERDGTPL